MNKQKRARKHWTDGDVRKLGGGERRCVLALGGGLVLRVAPGGAKSWAVRLMRAGRAETAGLGEWPGMSVSAARKHAAETVRRARCSAVALRAAAIRESCADSGRKVTVEAFGQRYVREITAKARKDVGPVERWLKRDIYPALGGLTVAEVKPEQIQTLVFGRRDAGKPAAAAAIRDLLARIFAYAKVCRLRDDNPVEATPAAFVYQAKERDRALSANELRIFFRKLRDRKLGAVYALCLELLLLTLARKSELRLARWRDVDLEKGEWEIPPENSKTGKAHVVYLSGRSVEIFQSLGRDERSENRDHYILPGKNSTTQPMAANAINRAMRRVKWEMPRFTVHDLRRTASTLLNEMDYDDDWIEAALNHSRGGIRGVYNKARYGRQRRKMLAEWSEYLESLRP